MKIAMTSYYLPSESKIGCGYQAHYMASALVERGHSVTMFSPCHQPEGASYDVRTVDVQRPLRTFKYALALRAVDFTEFDVVHFHGDDYWQWGRRRPVHVRTMHGSCLAEALHIRGFRGRLRMVALALGEYLGTLVADRTVCVSRNTLRYFPWLRDVIWNGVDVARFHPAGAKSAEPTILFVGTYGNRKRGKLLMEIFEREVRPVVPGVKLWMVCQDAPPAPGVEVLGRIPTSELARLYREAWVFCLPSTYEGFGVPYIEAMASGTPVVATPNVGACEVLDNSRYGSLVSESLLGTELTRLLQDTGERARMAQSGLSRAQAFTWTAALERYEALYEEVRTTSRRRSLTAASSRQPDAGVSA